MSWRNTKEYRKWRIGVLRRDKRCVVCGSIKHRQAHHLNCASYHKEDRFDVGNGITLCQHHHSLFHNKFKGGYRKKTTKKDFSKFMIIVEDIKNIKTQGELK